MYKYAYAVYSSKTRHSSLPESSAGVNMGLESPDKAYKEKLIRGVKKEVKQIMEEAVTKKFVHEDSGSITSLCAAVELCVSHGLKRRALGLFKSSSTTALLHKVAKTFQPAATIVQLVIEAETCDPNKRSSSGSESAGKLPLSTGIKPPLQKRNSTTAKFLWIRIALVEKQLARIIDHIVTTSSKYYEKYALVGDPDYGSILSSLLVGPCALDFSRLRTGEHLWTDPPADELVQRHRISSAYSPVPPSPPCQRRPPLHYKRSTVSSTLDDSQVSKDYVESLHQNNKSTLLYGKNNVLMILKEAKQPLAGYLSLHQCGETLTLKWTPNQLMSGVSEALAAEKSIYWEHAMNVTLREIVYLHCHQDAESDWIVLVGQDGVQRPPVHFPRGGHLLAFLSCLENGLLPHGQLDPPLWSQTGKGEEEEIAGKMFPKLRRRGSRIYRNGDHDTGSNGAGNEGMLNGNGESEQAQSDFVFRILYSVSTTYEQMEEMLENPLGKTLTFHKEGSVPVTPRSTPLHSISTTSSTSSSRSLEQNGTSVDGVLPGYGSTLRSMSVEKVQYGNPVSFREPIHVVCERMKRQIISRAFYGWLSHCRHLRTVRTHLVGLVRESMVKAEQESDLCEGLTEQKWAEMEGSGGIEMAEVYKLVYFGGMAHNLRRKLWPMMLRGSSSEVDMDAVRKEYEDRMGEWLGVEAIVRRRDREAMAANLAKLSSEGSAGGGENEQLPPSATKGLSTYGSNEVFEEVVHACSPKRNPPGVVSFSETVRNGCITEILGEKDEERGSVEVEESSSDGDSTGSPLPSGESSYSEELLETFGLNVHRIDKDVKRCDRNYWYFIERNLEKLRNVMCTYVWEHLEIGYVQGMCDLAAPLLVILDDEAEAYMCFKLLMERMSANFPIGGGAMDTHFANMRSLLQVLDHDLFTLIRQNGDYTHFYFCYRWFLLDFKREFSYQDVFLVWETIWAARQVASMDFVLFLALALLNYYRDIILSNSMDFTDIIKFFNEMAERHDAKVILQIARNLVLDLQTLIEDK